MATKYYADTLKVLSEPLATWAQYQKWFTTDFTHGPSSLWFFSDAACKERYTYLV